jgi:phosphatidylserine decarboxylase
MRLAKEGYPYLIPPLFISAIFFIIKVPLIGFLFFLLASAVGIFFRDPERKIPSGDNLILAPADGVVVEAGEEGEGEKKISIFMRLHDVHINRSPVTGKIKRVEHKKGRFHPAFRPEAGSENEQNRITLISKGRRFELTQIAGIIARRIVFSKNVDDEVKAGERIGMIEFGSRVELILPKESSLLSRVGEKVKGGETIIGELS